MISINNFENTYVLPMALESDAPLKKTPIKEWSKKSLTDEDMPLVSTCSKVVKPRDNLSDNIQLPSLNNNYFDYLEQSITCNLSEEEHESIFNKILKDKKNENVKYLKKHYKPDALKSFILKKETLSNANLHHNELNELKKEMRIMKIKQLRVKKIQK